MGYDVTVTGRTLVVETTNVGRTGKSAYEIWLDAGNTGTRTDFLDSIAVAAANQVYGARDAAQAAAIAGAESEANAAQSETNAAQSEANAAASEENAAESASAAAGSASSAAESATTATTKAAEASTSAGQAASSATAAAASASAAAASAATAQAIAAAPISTAQLAADIAQYPLVERMGFWANFKRNAYLTAYRSGPPTAVEFGNIFSPFVRATAKYTYDPSGLSTLKSVNVPAFEFDPITAERRGLLTERDRTNLFLWARAFNAVNWTRGRATITPNVAFGPTGEQLVDKLVETTDNNTHIIFQGAAVLAGAQYTYDLEIGPDERTRADILFGDGAGGYWGVSLDLLTGEVSTHQTGGGITDGTSLVRVRPAGFGFWRVNFTATMAGSGTAFLQIRISNGSSVSYAGDGTSGILLSYAGLFAGDYAGSYVLSGANPAVVSADVWEVDQTLLSQVLPQGGPFTLILHVENMAHTRSLLHLITDTASFNDRVHITAYSAGLQFVSIVGGEVQSNITYTSEGPTGDFKIAFRVEENNFGAAVNGAMIGTDLSALIPDDLTRMLVASNPAGAGRADALFKLIGLFPGTATDAQLVEWAS